MVTRIILAIVAVLLLLAGLAAGAVAAWGYTSIGSDGVVHLPIGTVSPEASARAAIVDVGTFTVTAPYVGALGESELSVTSADPGRTLFIGAAATADADAYLAGVPYAAAFRDGDAWSARSVPGGQPLPSTTSGRWLVQATGVSPAIAVPSARPLSLVVADPAGEPVGAFELAVAFTIADASAWLLGLAIAAGVLVVAGAVLILLALRRRRAVGRHAAGQVVTTETAAETEAASETATDETTELPVVEGEQASAQAESDEVVDGVVFVIDTEAMEAPAAAVDEADEEDDEPTGQYGDLQA